MGLYRLNQNGIWKKLKVYRLNSNGIWKNISGYRLNQNGIWKKIWGVVVQRYTFQFSKTLFIGTNGYISLDQFNSTSNIASTLKQVLGILPKDLIQESLRYAADTTNFYLLWTGRRFSGGSTGEIQYEVWFPDGEKYALISLTQFPSSTYSPTAFYEDGSNADLSTVTGSRTSGSKWTVYFNTTNATTASFTPKGTSWNSWSPLPVPWLSDLSPTSTDDGFTTINANMGTVPTAPTNLTVTNVTSTSATLNWQAPANGGYGLGMSALKKYEYRFSTDPNFVGVSWITSGNNGTDTSATITKSAGAAYYWQVRAYNQLINTPNGGAGAIANGDTIGSNTPVQAPTLQLMQIFSTSFYAMITNIDETQYSYSATATAGTTSFSSPNKDFVYNENLTTGQTSTLTVRATVLSGPNAGLYAESSVTATTVADSPTNVSVGEYSSGSYPVTWTAYTPAGFNNYNVYVYESTNGGSSYSYTFSASDQFSSPFTNSWNLNHTWLGASTTHFYVTVAAVNQYGFVIGSISSPSNVRAKYSPPGGIGLTCSVSGSTFNWSVNSGVTVSFWSIASSGTGSSFVYFNPFYSGSNNEFLSSRSSAIAEYEGSTAGNVVTCTISVTTNFGNATASANYTTVGNAGSGGGGGGGGTPPPSCPPPPGGGGGTPPPSCPPPPPPKSIGVATLIRTTDGLVPAGSLLVGDKLISADISGFPYNQYNGVTDFALNWSDTNPEITLKETEIVSINSRVSQFAIVINQNIFSDTHYILVKRNNESRFIISDQILETDYVFNYSGMSWDPIVTLQKVEAAHSVVSINCEPYDIFFTENMLVHDSVDI